jgi:hypothetical protein
MTLWLCRSVAAALAYGWIRNTKTKAMSAPSISFARRLVMPKALFCSII